MKYILVTTTFESGTDVNNLITDILNEKLGTYCQIDHAISYYGQKEKWERKEGVRLCIQTKASLYKELETLIKDSQPNKVPEIIAVPIIDGFAPYLDWIEKETK